MTVDAAVRELLSNQVHLSLATLDDEGQPQISMVTAYWDGTSWWVLVSGLAAHTAALRAQKPVSVMLMGDVGPQPFARARLTTQCAVQLMDASASVSSSALQTMKTLFGPIIDMLTSLPDFCLVRLLPQTGRYVAGFGAAWTLDCPSMSVVGQVRGG